MGSTEIRRRSGEIHPRNGLDLFVQALERFKGAFVHAAHGETGGAVALAEDLQRIGCARGRELIGQFHAVEETLPGVHLHRQALLNHVRRQPVVERRASRPHAAHVDADAGAVQLRSTLFLFRAQAELVVSGHLDSPRIEAANAVIRAGERNPANPFRAKPANRAPAAGTFKRAGTLPAITGGNPATRPARSKCTFPPCSRRHPYARRCPHRNTLPHGGTETRWQPFR